LTGAAELEFDYLECGTELAAFERFVDALITLTDKTSEAPAGRRTDTTTKAVA
jgi:hypothetical protein